MGNIKKRGTFSFIIKSTNEVKTRNLATLRSENNNISIFLDGVIYNNNQEELLSGFALNGVDYVKQLEGSFIIFLLAGSDFYILTDKVNSRKAYYAFIEDEWHISNNVDNLPKDKFQVSLDGLACYLANGVMLNDLTLFQGINSARRAGIHFFQEDRCIVTTYWDYIFSYTRDVIQEEEYEEKLKRLLINSINRRYVASSDTAISLSAGYDSRGILGILYKYIHAKKISCISYRLGTKAKIDSDAMLSKKLAETCGYEHKIIPSYNGDLISLLKKNALEGKCNSYFCYELDVWHSLAENNFCSDIFVGDECFGWYDVPLNNSTELLNSVRIYGASGIDGLKGIISDKTYLDFCIRLDKLTADIVDKTTSISNPHDKKDYLYLDQRINHVQMPWRENMLGQVGFVHNPYLDGDILNFMMKIPPEFRKDKSLFKKTISNLLPDLFTIPLANFDWSYIRFWQNEFIRNKKSLVMLVLGTNSRLDNFISKEEIVVLINRRCSKLIRVESFLKRGLNFISNKNQIARKALNIIFGSWSDFDSRSDYLLQILLRILLVRIYLSD
jgi:asparagine synthase (glutamine-hydrolysing)